MCNIYFKRSLPDRNDNKVYVRAKNTLSVHVRMFLLIRASHRFVYLRAIHYSTGIEDFTYNVVAGASFTFSLETSIWCNRTSVVALAWTSGWQLKRKLFDERCSLDKFFWLSGDFKIYLTWQFELSAYYFLETDLAMVLFAVANKVHIDCFSFLIGQQVYVVMSKYSDIIYLSAAKITIFLVVYYLLLILQVTARPSVVSNMPPWLYSIDNESSRETSVQSSWRLCSSITSGQRSY